VSSKRTSEHILDASHQLDSLSNTERYAGIDVRAAEYLGGCVFLFFSIIAQLFALLEVGGTGLRVEESGSRSTSSTHARFSERASPELPLFG